MNLSTFIVLVIVIVLVVLSIWAMIRGRKKGGHCGGCSGCPHSDTCHKSTLKS